MVPVIASAGLLATVLYAWRQARNARKRKDAQPVPVMYFPKPAAPSLKDTAVQVRTEAASAIAALQQNTGIVPPNLKPSVQQERVVLSLDEVDGPAGASIFREPWPYF